MRREAVVRECQFSGLEHIGESLGKTPVMQGEEPGGAHRLSLFYKQKRRVRFVDAQLDFEVSSSADFNGCGQRRR